MKLTSTYSLAYLSFLILLTACKDSKKTDFIKENNTEREYIKVGDFSNLEGIDTANTVVVEQHVLENHKDTLLLKNLNELIGDPQLYSIIKLKNNNAVYELKNIQGYKIYPKTKINFNNLVDSELIFMTENKLKEKLIFVWDYQYPDCSNLFEIIKISKPKPTKIFSEDILLEEISINEEKTILRISALKNCGETQKEFEVRL